MNKSLVVLFCLASLAVASGLTNLAASVSSTLPSPFRSLRGSHPGQVRVTLGFDARSAPWCRVTFVSVAKWQNISSRIPSLVRPLATQNSASASALPVRGFPVEGCGSTIVQISP